MALLLPVSTKTKASENSNIKSLSIVDYKNYLKNYSTQDAKNAGVSQQYINSSVKDSKKVLSNFESLSLNKQQELLDKINNIENINNELKQKQEKENYYSLNSIGISYRTATLTTSWNPDNFPNVLEFRDSVKYKVQGGAVLKIVDSDNYVTHNYVPFVSTNKNGNNTHVTSDNLAYTWSRWEYREFFKSAGVTVGNCNFSIWGNSQGEVVKSHLFKS